MIFIKKKYLYGVLFIFLIGSLLHFTYEWSNQNFFVGLFSAVNESVFEHTKLLILPTFLWYILSYKYSKLLINIENYYTSLIISLITSILSIPLLFYFVKYGLAINSAIINIFIFFLSTLFGQLVAHHFYKYSKEGLRFVILYAISILIVVIYVGFTIFPANLPIFVAP